MNRGALKVAVADAPAILELQYPAVWSLAMGFSGEGDFTFQVFQLLVVAP
jgi:hypothetical protein